MLAKLLRNWMAPKANPIGVDFGSDALRLAQVTIVEGEYRLTAAASAAVPSEVRRDEPARLRFFVEKTRELLGKGAFQGRTAVLGLPAARTFIQHLRMGRMDDAATKKALEWEARGKLPIDPSQALLRHIVAGEVYHDQEAQNEVIVMAAGKQFVDDLLSSAARAKLDVVGMNVEAKAVVDCFSRIYRRKTDAEMTSCFVDIGAVGTRATIARSRQILFARSIAVGGDHFNRAAAASLGMSVDEVKALRIAQGSAAAAMVDPARAISDHAEPVEAGGMALLGAQLARRQHEGDGRSDAVALMDSRESGVQSGRWESPKSPPPATEPAMAIEQACDECVTRLIEELDLCRRYYEATFPNRPVDRLIFVGAEARQRGLCQRIAREMGLAAQVGDPMVRMNRTTQVGIDSGIDRRQPQPGWAVAIGLSMGA